MTATTITEYELSTVKADVQAASLAIANYGTTSPQATEAIARVWEKLASYGDQYAAAAHQGISDPTSMYGQVIRNSFAAAGADISKFNVVALTHLTTYVSLIGARSNLDGTFTLPMTTDIESSYYNASSTIVGTPYTAVDLNIASIGTQAPFPTWYISSASSGAGGDIVLIGASLVYRSLTPQVVVDPARIGETAPEVRDTMQPSLAAQSFAAVTAATAETLFQTFRYQSGMVNQTIQADAQALMSLLTGGSSQNIVKVGGLYFFNNPVTGTLAIFDGLGRGQAMIEGRWQTIDSTNWSVESGVTNVYKYLDTSTWKVAGEFRTDQYVFLPQGMAASTSATNLALAAIMFAALPGETQTDTSGPVVTLANQWQNALAEDTGQIVSYVRTEAGLKVLSSNGTWYALSRDGTSGKIYPQADGYRVQTFSGSVGAIASIFIQSVSAPTLTPEGIISLPNALSDGGVPGDLGILRSKWDGSRSLRPDIRRDRCSTGRRSTGGT